MSAKRSDHETEIIAVTSGKGGTGKTIISACLGYALTRAGLRVLIVDADTATDGLSLFLLGQQGVRQRTSLLPENTFANVLERRLKSEPLDVRPFHVNRGGSDDHGVIYEALISSRGLYGDLPPPNAIDRDLFRDAVQQLFRTLIERDEYDYVLIDTRGGFSYETTDVCALAHSFILVAEADPTSFYQARNLVREVSAAAAELERRPILRSIFVNKALEVTQQSDRLDLEKMEVSFRLEVVKEFEPTGITFEDTHPVPLDAELLWAYKSQRVPFRHEPAYRFSFAVLAAFSQILRVVTSPWTRQQAAAWNELVDAVSDTIRRRNEAAQQAMTAARERDEALGKLEQDVARFENEVQRSRQELVALKDSHERELAYVRETLERRHQREIEDRRVQAERELSRTEETLERVHQREISTARRSLIVSLIATAVFSILIAAFALSQYQRANQSAELVSASATSQAVERAALAVAATSQAADRAALLATIQAIETRTASATLSAIPPRSVEVIVTATPTQTSAPQATVAPPTPAVTQVLATPTVPPPTVTRVATPSVAATQGQPVPTRSLPTPAPR